MPSIRGTYIRKTIDDNTIGFKSRMIQHINDGRTRVSTCKFPIYVYMCGLKNKCLNEPFLEIKVMIQLKNSNQLETYQNYFHQKDFDTLNCHEYLKKQ